MSQDSHSVAEKKSLASGPTALAQTAPYTIFDKRQKALITLIVAVAATFSGFASNIYFPALPTIASDLDVSIELVTLTVTSYLIFQGLAPSLWGPVSDVKGRRTAYALTLIVLFAACIGLAETRAYAQLLVLRCLQSTGSASTIAIGAGVIGDITTRQDRGGFMGVFQAGLLVPTAVGPVIGGALAGTLGWRSIFWLLTIYCGVFLVILILMLPETLRSLVGNGSRAPSSIFTRYPLVFYQKSTQVNWDRRLDDKAQVAAPKRINIFGPLRMLISKQAGPIIVYLAIYYTVWQMSITAMSSLFERHYDLDEVQIGLTFIANGVGSMIGTLVSGKLLDFDYRRVKTKYKQSQQTSPVDSEDDHSFPLEKARLRLLPAFSAVQCMSILLFGWTIQYPRRVSIAVPIVSTFVTGWTATSIQSLVTTYLVDIFHDRSAAATASLNLARCLCAAGGTSFIIPLIDAIGVGPAFSICVAAQVFALAILAVQWKYGGKWRRDALARQKGVA